MGQKVNPNIFRLGVNKTWKTEFFEKKRHELPVYTFKDLEIKSYIEQFLETQGILLHDYKQHYSNSTLTLYISYFVSPEFLLTKREKTNHLILSNSRTGARKLISDSPASTIKSFMRSKPSSFPQATSDSYRIKRYLDMSRFPLGGQDRRGDSDLSLSQIEQSFKIEGVLGNMFKVLSLFTNNKFNLIISFCNINKDLNFLKRTQRKNFLLLRKFKGTPFLKEGIELLLHVVYNKASADLLSKFIQIQIKKVKRQKFFLVFLKQTLTILLNSNLSKVKGVKILIKGRFNGVPRASHKTLVIGDVPVQTINSMTSYSQRTAHNSSGSYGIKVWIIEKPHSTD